jgi:hypothetical protein
MSTHGAATTSLARIDGAASQDPLFDAPSEPPQSRIDLLDVPLPRGRKSLEEVGVIVQVLGPIEVLGWELPPERAVVTELLLYLALHRGQRFSGDRLRYALRPDEDQELSAKTLRTYLSMLRKCLGPDYVTSGADGYGVPWYVDTDFAVLERQCKEGPIERRLFLLDFIRGRPFEGVPAGGYGWLFSELWISRIETTIVASARDFALECLEAGLNEQAEHCVRQGLVGVPHDISLWELRLQIAAASGGAILDTAKQEAAAALGPDHNLL